ncbi:nucleotide disphospho-sugar-binding domain-containing protein [Crossiella sp. NPDC003009]
MRVLFTTWAWPSHYYPLVPLAWACRTAGHDVRVISQPELAPVIARSGLPAVAIGRDLPLLSTESMRGFARLLSIPGISLEWEDLRQHGPATVALYVEMAEAMTDDVIAFARRWRPELIVYDPTTYAGPLAAAALGVPAVRSLWGIDYPALSSEFEPAALAGLLARLGLSEVDTLGRATVDPCPPSLQLDRTGVTLRMRHLPYNGPGAAPRWLLAPPRRPRICVTWGTSTTRICGAELFGVPTVLDALAGLDAEVVVTVSGPERELLAAGPGVRVVADLPLHLVLDSCDLIIAQGGGGTLMAAAGAGVPQLLLPRLTDQLYNSRRLAAAGCGVALVNGPGTGEIRQAAETVLADPGYRLAAAGLRAEMRAQPSAREVVRELERLTTAGSGRTPRASR